MSPEFTVEIFHNEYLPEGGREVDAIVSVTGSGMETSTVSSAHVIMIDCSGSMGDPSGKITAARVAVRAALDALPDGVLVAVVAGRHDARMVFPRQERMVVLDSRTRRQAQAAADHLVPSGGTAIGTWLQLARQLMIPHPDRIRHALLLTDGRNEHEGPEALAAALDACDGVLTCDCRGVGTDWVVEEVRGIGSRLLGTVDIVAEPADLAADFAGIVGRASTKGVGDVALRVWTPRGATLHSLKQVSPTVEDLTGRRTADASKPLIGLYPTGAWGDESREYHLRVVLDPLGVGEQILAARVGVVVPSLGAAPLAETRVRAEWTTDSVLSTRLDRRVAHYTGQAELAYAIAEGLDARRAGDVPTATARLGRAVALAAESGNDEVAALLGKVVEVDSATSRVRLREGVMAADEMTLDVRSTRTARVRGS